MKSLILKDLYNISHNAKSMLLILLLFAVLFLPQNSYGPQSYIITCGLLCSMMTITTFSFDENCKWTRYATVMPISKRDYVAAKFLVQLIFAAAGAVWGLVTGLAFGAVLHKLSLTSASDLISMLVFTGVSLAASEICGAVSIPLLFQFGAEKARIMTLVSIFIPLGLCFIVYQLLKLMGIPFTDRSVTILLIGSPFIAAAWNWLMYQISCRIFLRKELNN